MQYLVSVIADSAGIARATPEEDAAIDVFNIADVKWNDIEYYYVSRLKNEASPVPDYVVHPGVPRTVRARLQYQF